MKKYLLGALTFFFALGLSAFTNFAPSKIKKGSDILYQWYPVNYDVIPGGIIPYGTPPAFNHLKTVADATALDGCTDDYYRHCLRGFYYTPPVFPTAAYDESTPRP